MNTTFTMTSCTNGTFHLGAKGQELQLRFIATRYSKYIPFLDDENRCATGYSGECDCTWAINENTFARTISLFNLMTEEIEFIRQTVAKLNEDKTFFLCDGCYALKGE